MELNERDKEYIKQYGYTLSFHDYQKLAQDESLKTCEKVGFPAAYREGFEHLIFTDIKTKLNSLNMAHGKILDIGAGCSKLSDLIIENAEKLNQELILCDSEEMLKLLADKIFIKKLSGQFPSNIKDFEPYKNKIDGILIYSVINIVMIENNIFNFIDSALDLLKSGGELLIGDIANISKRERFFSSEKGIKYHQEFTKSDSLPELKGLSLQKNTIDDSIVFGILQRYRNFGCETYLLPQNPKLIMYNRREDILIVKQ
jgi:cyclopropane fatty-acyl-phospholipid synthase-like methyltransferase